MWDRIFFWRKWVDYWNTLRLAKDLKDTSESLGEEKTAKISHLLSLGVNHDEIAECINIMEMVKDHVVDDEFLTFHNELDGEFGPGFFSICFILIEEFGCDLDEAIRFMRVNPEMITTFILYKRYKDAYRQVIEWEYERLSDKEKETKRKEYLRNGPQGHFAKLVRERLKKKRNETALLDIEARDAKLRRQVLEINEELRKKEEAENAS